MPFSEASSQFEHLLFQMKQYKGLTKTTINIQPSSGQTDYGPGTRTIFTLPYASLVTLADIALHFDFEGIPQLTTPEQLPVSRIVPPRDIALLISEMDIKINGQVVQHLTAYADLVNILNLMTNDKTAKRVLSNSNPSYSKVPGAAGSFIAIDNVEFRPTLNTNNVKKNYIINQWIGLLGERGTQTSSNFIDTNLLGEVSISITWNSANVCIFSPAGSEAAVKSAAGRGTAAVGVPEINAALALTTASYKLTNLKMSMVRYNLPVEYSEAIQQNISSGSKYMIAFDHYEHNRMLANKSSGTIRFNINSKDVKSLIAYFTNADRANAVVPSAYNPANNNSVYFKYDNTLHDNSQFQLGSVLFPQNALNSTECFLELVRGIPGARGNNTFEFSEEIRTVEDFLENSFIAMLSLEMTEGCTALALDNKKLLSGLSSEHLPLSCSYTYKNVSSAFATGAPWNKDVNVIVRTTRLLVIENGQKVSVEL